MAERLTNAGRSLLASHQGNGTHLQVDKFILANIPGQLPSDVIDPDRGMPSAGQIVHEQVVTKDGYASPDMVVYSLTMDATVGPFTFNTLYVVASSENNAVIMIITVPETSKIATNVGSGIRGQSMVRNAVLVYDDAAAITNITVEAEAWQFTYEHATTEIKGLGEVATKEEALLGKDNWRWITPYTLKEYVADWWAKLDLDLSWDSITGKPGFKSAALLDAGQNQGQVALIGSPSTQGRTAVIVSSGSNVHGYYRIWSDGFIEQYGLSPVVTPNNEVKQIFPVAFNSLKNVQVSAAVGSSSGGSVASVGRRSATYSYLCNGDSDTAFYIFWRAIGD
ncbi:phage tail protein [Endozoicomonas ascidiicola]|uniref:phage tail-collar fiber domain-containing protein n=1 Tax=Endozoicomonas ascidiicola TaxID=1698521 RepID=UPI0008345D43|nr:phage tail protein [Endozoicomonas ascidiicola]